MVGAASGCAIGDTSVGGAEGVRGRRAERGVVGRWPCNLEIEQLQAAVDATNRLGIGGYELVQNGYSLLQPDEHADVRRASQDLGLALTAFSPLAGGVLTGTYRRDEAAPEGSRLDLRPEG